VTTAVIQRVSKRRLAEKVRQSRGPSKKSSKYVGVCWRAAPRKWYAQFHRRRAYVFLGSYATEEDAAKAYDYYLVNTMGYSAVNFPRGDHSQEPERAEPEWKKELRQQMARLEAETNLTEIEEAVAAERPLNGLVRPPKMSKHPIAWDCANCGARYLFEPAKCTKYVSIKQQFDAVYFK